MPQIDTNQWLAELDKFIDSSSDGLRLFVTDRGFTVYDVMERCGFKRWKAMQMILDGLRNGRIKHIGYRPGHGGINVYETIKEK